MNWEIFWPVLAALSIAVVVTLFLMGNLLSVHRSHLNALVREALADFELYERTNKKIEASREMATATYNSSVISTRNNLEWNHSLMSCDLKHAEAKQLFTGADRDDWKEWKQSQLDKVDEELAEYSDEDDE